MKRLLLFLLFTLSLFANDQKAQSKIIDTILNNISFQEQKLIYSDDKQLLETLGVNHSITYDSNKANLLILQDSKNLPKNYKNKKIFVLNYKLLSKVPESFGAFFFKKGRANIIFLKPKLKQNNIEITNKLEPYLEDKIW